MTRDELKKKRKEMAESNGYQGYVPKSKREGTRTEVKEEVRNPEPMQEKKSTWSNVMQKIGNTMDYISGGQIGQKFNRDTHLVRNNFRNPNQEEKKNTSLQQDVRNMGRIVGQSVKGSGQKIMNYIENATLNNSKQYQEIEKQRGIAQYSKENPNKPIMTASDKFGNRQILSDVSVTPTKDKINKKIDETEQKIQTLTEKQNNPVTRKLSELLPSITQSVVGMGASAINPAVRTNILANFCWWRLCETS